MQHALLPSCVALLCLTGCRDVESEPAPAAEPARATTTAEATAIGGGSVELTDSALDAGRHDDAWRAFAESDTTAPSSRRVEPVADTTQTWSDIAAETVNDPTMPLPLGGQAEGPAVARIQILLDRAGFSPGQIDGRWGKNTEKAVYWYQRQHGLDGGGTVTTETAERLGDGSNLVRRHRLTVGDVEGPFPDLPAGVYQRAELECLCYESLAEKLGELFHASPALLRQLNPGVDLNALTAGDEIRVPAVGERPAPADSVARVIISDGGHYLHAVSADGRVIYHFPSTLGSEYAPSPTGDYRVTSIAPDPTWHYQPDLLTGVPDQQEPAILPPGPNNAVGTVWIQLSVDHYGIHGTSAPETIGYATSNGCVRLTNWDAEFLAEHIGPGTPVEFRDAGRRPTGGN